MVTFTLTGVTAGRDASWLTAVPNQRSLKISSHPKTMRAGPLKARVTTSLRSDFRSIIVRFFMGVRSLSRLASTAAYAQCLWEGISHRLASKMSDIDIAKSIALGIGLAAATGFRVFLPLLVTSAAAYSGHLHLGTSFAWLGTLPALLMLGAAAVVEVLAYYIPVVDHLLDTITTPAALVAGTLLAASVMIDVPPAMKWAIAVIAGGGAAGLTQGATAFLRGASTVATAGLGNHVLSTGELGGSLLLSLLALIAPYLALSLILLTLPLLGWFVVRSARRRSRGRDVVETRPE
jgi:hypothetical protein